MRRFLAGSILGLMIATTAPSLATTSTQLKGDDYSSIGVSGKCSAISLPRGRLFVSCVRGGLLVLTYDFPNSALPGHHAIVRLASGRIRRATWAASPNPGMLGAQIIFRTRRATITAVYLTR